MSAKQFKVKKILESVGSLTYREIGENDGQFESNRAQFHTYHNIKAQSFSTSLKTVNTVPRGLCAIVGKVINK